MFRSWIDSERELFTYDESIELDNSFQKIEIVPGLKTTLFPHQKTIVKAMVDLENNRNIKARYSNFKFDIKNTSGVLSEAVVSGKTIDILENPKSDYTRKLINSTFTNKNFRE